MNRGLVNSLALTHRPFRQAVVFRWVRDTFGRISDDRDERARRVLEEAIELVQAAGLSQRDASAMVAHVYSRPPGDVRQEVGGLGITLLAFAHHREINADAEEVNEFLRVIDTPVSFFRKRQNAKAAAGIAGYVDVPMKRASDRG